MNDRSTILVVDDDAGMRETVRVILGPGYDYGFADCASAAERLLGERSFELVLLDLHMPGGSGMSLLPVIERVQPGTQVIIVTAFGNFDKALDAFEYGVAGFLEKDFSPSHLQRVVHRALDRRKQAQLVASLKKRLTDTSHDLRDDLDRALRSEQAVMTGKEDVDRLSFYRVLAEVLESQDAMTAGHSLRVSRHAVALGRHLDLDDGSIGDLEQAGYLHDIGKVGINKTLLNHEGTFTKLQRVEIERHPSLGAEILIPLGLPVRTIEGVQQHHERLDGTGYPAKLPGDQISLFARIISVVDSFDAMTWPRIYRPQPFTPEGALEILQRETDRYDGGVLRALRESIAEGAIETKIERNPYTARRRDRDTLEPQHASLQPLGLFGGTDEGSTAHLPSFSDEDEPSVTEHVTSEAHSYHWFRFLPLADFYVGDDLSTLLRVERDDSGVHAIEDPVTGKSLPLLFSARTTFERRIREEGLRPLYARREAGAPAFDDAPGRSPAVWLEATDGHHLFLVNRMEGHDGRAVWTAERGYVETQLLRADVQRGRILEGLAAEHERERVERALDVVQDWVDSQAPVFHHTPPSRRFTDPRSGLQYHGLSAGQVSEIHDRLEAEDLDSRALRTVFSRFGRFDDVGTVVVELRSEPRPMIIGARVKARDLRIARLPVSSKAAIRAMRQLSRAGRTVGDLLDRAETPREFTVWSRQLGCVQADLWRREETYLASLLGAAVKVLRVSNQVYYADTGRQYELFEMRLREIPTPTDALRRKVRALRASMRLQSDARIADVLAGTTQENVEATVAALFGLRRACSSLGAVHASMVLMTALSYVNRTVTALAPSLLAEEDVRDRCVHPAGPSTWVSEKAEVDRLNSDIELELLESGELSLVGLTPALGVTD
jgi:putative two-component system response regulator